jgi:hypothetical protein
MSKRQNIITFDSTEVQGEGSWIKVRMITHGQGKMFQRAYSDILGMKGEDISTERRAEFQQASDDLVVEMVFEWNWVDDDDNPLPLPKDDPTVVDLLTELEHKFIGQALQGEGERKK